METSDKKSRQEVSSWIVSLAVSVTCCAILLVFFANYLAEIKRTIATENERLETMATHEDQLLMEIKSLHHAMTMAAAPAQASPPVAMQPPTPLVAQPENTPSAPPASQPASPTAPVEAAAPATAAPVTSQPPAPPIPSPPVAPPPAASPAVSVPVMPAKP